MSESDLGYREQSNNGIIWGATGQAKVVRPILEAGGRRIIALFDNDPNRDSPFADVPIVGDWTEFLLWQEKAERCSFVVAIGGERRGFDRVRISRDVENFGFVPVEVVHQRSWVAASAQLGKGCQIMALAGVGEHAVIGDYCIVNTNATIDHDCRLSEGVHVMPGATIAGEVEIDRFATIGANATVLPRLKIGSGAVVGAGAVVTRSVPDGMTVVGNPAKAIVGRSIPSARTQGG
jgi:sugar O-acyltransferase (sialic acid O-acetyltransferase NeuD family)